MIGNEGEREMQQKPPAGLGDVAVHGPILNIYAPGDGFTKWAYGWS